MIDGPRRFVPAAVGAILFLDLVAYTALLPLLPALQRDLGASEIAIGLLVGVLAWGTLVLGLPMSAVTDRVGPRRTNLLGTALAGASLIAFGASASFGLLLGFRLAQGVASAAMWIAGPAWAAAGTTGTARDRRTTAVTSAGMVGTIVGPAFGAWLSSPGDPLRAFSILGWTLLVGTGVLTLATRRLRNTEQLRRPRFRDSTVVWRSGRFVIGAGAVAVAAFTVSAESVILTLGLGDRGAGTTLLGVTFSVAGAGLAVTQAASPRLFPRWPGERRMAVALLGLGGCMALPAIVPTVSGLVASVIGLSLLAGFAYGTGLALISGGSEETGSTVAVALAYWTVLWSAGASVGPAFHGWMLGRVGESTAVLVAAALPVLAVPWVVRIARRGLRWPAP